MNKTSLQNLWLPVGRISNPSGASKWTDWKFVLLAFLLAGCQADTGSVSGKVTFNGKPLPSGTVTFISEDGRRVERGLIQSDGRFAIPKAPIGRVRVTVITLPASPSRQAAKSGASTQAFVPIPTRYADDKKSGLNHVVTAGEQTFDIDLKPD